MGKMDSHTQTHQSPRDERQNRKNINTKTIVQEVNAKMGKWKHTQTHQSPRDERQNRENRNTKTIVQEVNATMGKLDSLTHTDTHRHTRNA
jgi:hypothetical protein